jgi:hypothetical protein
MDAYLQRLQEAITSATHGMIAGDLRRHLEDKLRGAANQHSIPFWNGVYCLVPGTPLPPLAAKSRKQWISSATRC